MCHIIFYQIEISISPVVRPSFPEPILQKFIAKVVCIQ